MRLKNRVNRLERAHRARTAAEEFVITPADRERMDRLIDETLADPEANPDDYAALQAVLGDRFDEFVGARCAR